MAVKKKGRRSGRPRRRERKNVERGQAHITSTFNNIATKKCPSSCIMINVIIMMNGINDAVSIDNTANI